MIENEQINILQKEKFDIVIDEKHIEALVENKFETIKAPWGLGLYASDGENYQYAIFGRDSIEAVEDLLLINPGLTRDILITMASMQGVESNDKTEEQFGKIHHEYRAFEMGGVTVPEKSKKIIEILSSRWGGSDKMFCYYGSVDSTPLFVRLVGQYVSECGSEILDQEVLSVNGSKKAFRNHVRDAAEWVKDHVESSDWGLLEFKHINPQGLAYQAWKDSRTGYLHLDGTPASADNGIASIEVQGYAYDALIAASELNIFSSYENRQYLILARRLQDNVLKRMWIDDDSGSYFAIGLDRDDNGMTRQIMTCTSNTAAVLDSNLLLDLPENDRIGYVQPIVDIIMSEDFLTDVGGRTRSLRHKDLIDFADYHGSLVSWPKETYDITKGLRRHGFIDQAVQLENCLLMSSQKSNEFYYVNVLGEIRYDYARGGPDQSHLDGEISIPEKCQGLTISAIIKILDSRK